MIQRNIGEILKNYRHEHNIDINVVANYLKVRVRDIEYLENNNLKKIAQSIYLPGLIKSYAKYLNIKIEDHLQNQSELLLEQNIKVDENALKILRQQTDSSNLKPSKNLILNSLIISLTLMFVFLLIFYFLENNTNLINTESIISVFKNT